MSQPSMDVGSIAIVEDEPVLRRLMRLWLEADGYTVVEYSNGREATLFDTGGTAIVCLDLRLEDTSGQNVLHELRARDPDLPIIVVTGDQELETAALAMRAGAYDFVTKPFDRERLGQAVRRAMERRQLLANVRRLERELGERTAQGSVHEKDTTHAHGADEHDLSNGPDIIESSPPPPMVGAEGYGDGGNARMQEGSLPNDIAVGGGSTLNLREIERVAIAQALKLAGGSVGKAAKLLGIGRATLYRRLSEQRSPMGGDEGPAREPELRSHTPGDPVNKLNGHVART